MITTTHVLLSLAVLDRRPAAVKSAAAASAAVVVGALLPDVMMLVFYLIQKLGNVPEAQIWRENYYLSRWQATFDLFNSLPLIAALAAFAWWRDSRLTLLVCASMALHVALDLPLHHDDGHRHLWPLSQWRFVSPVSYWDPQHFGDTIRWLELLLALLCGAILLRRYRSWQGRLAIALLLLSYVVFAVFALLIWGG